MPPVGSWGPDIFCSVLPLAFNSSGLAVVSGAVVGALVLLWWLLRRDSREEAAEEREQETRRSEDGE